LRPPETFIPKPATVNRVLKDGEILPEILGGLQVVATPGHAPGHLAFWHPERKILFCGDVLFNWPNLRLPFAPLTVDMTENKRSIAKIAALEPEIVCFGHGRPLVKNAAARLQAMAKRYR
jgi:glyoxylase-like metal-dependent hydrolase (beta-lactamase superfamily II)